MDRALEEEKRPKAKRSKKDYAATCLTSEPVATHSDSQPGLADKVDELCQSANVESAGYVSFKSFLGIQVLPEGGGSHLPVEPKVGEASEEEKGREEVCQRPPCITVASSSHVRLRPTKAKAQSGSTIKELKESIESLIKKK